MPTLPDVRHFFSRPDGTWSRLRRRFGHGRVAYAGTQAERLAAEAAAPQARREGRTATAPKEPSVLERLEEHLRERETRSSRLLERIEPTLDALPALARLNTEMLQTLREQASHADERFAAVKETLARLADGLTGQGTAIGRIEERIETASRSADDLASAIDELRDGLSAMTRAQGASTDAVRGLADVVRRREDEIHERLVRTQKWMVAGVLCCAAASVAAMLASIAGLL